MKIFISFTFLLRILVLILDFYTIFKREFFNENQVRIISTLFISFYCIITEYSLYMKLKWNSYIHIFTVLFIKE